MKSEIIWGVIENSIATRLGGNPSFRLVRKLTGYAFNILRVAGWPPADSADYETIINGVCNASVIGSEELL